MLGVYSANFLPLRLASLRVFFPILAKISTCVQFYYCHYFFYHPSKVFLHILQCYCVLCLLLFATPSKVEHKNFICRQHCNEVVVHGDVLCPAS